MSAVSWRECSVSAKSGVASYFISSTAHRSAMSAPLGTPNPETLRHGVTSRCLHPLTLTAYSHASGLSYHVLTADLVTAYLQRGAAAHVRGDTRRGHDRLSPRQLRRLVGGAARHGPREMGGQLRQPRQRHAPRSGRTMPHLSRMRQACVCCTEYFTDLAI